MMKATVLMCLFCGVLALTVRAEEVSRFRSVNDIVAVLNPLDVIANHDGVRRSIDLDIRFALDSSVLLPTANIQVGALAQALLSIRLDGYNIQVIGHTDASGNTDSNLKLSNLRAQSVITNLVDKYAVDPQKLLAQGMGESRLIKGLAVTDPRHRRVEIVAVAMTDYDPLQSGVNAKVSNQSGDNAAISSGGEQKINW